MNFRLPLVSFLLVAAVATSWTSITVTAGAPAQSAAVEGTALEKEAYRRWQESPHGRMLRRILPPGPKAGDLPEPDSPGARALSRYCVQCHFLPSPAMHTAQNWPRIVKRMNWRMQGKGNLGTVMKDMMEGVEAPSDAELEALDAYLAKYAQKPIDRKRYDLETGDGRAFDLACSQCHNLPDPKRHTASEWPKVVDRMKRHLEWIGTVHGRAPNPEGELQEERIVAFLQRNARVE